MSRLIAPHIRRSALIALAAALLSGTAAAAAEAPSGPGLIETLVQRAVGGIDPGGKPQEALPPDAPADQGPVTHPDDKATDQALAARRVLPQAFPASREDLLRDRLLQVSDFRERRPLRATVERLRGKAARQPVRVIVTLRSRFTPDGLLGEAGSREQRGVIAHLQQRLLGDLQPRLRSGAAKLGRRYHAVPMLALSVDAGALEQLAAHADVAAIDEDQMMKPALAGSAAAMGAADARDRGHVGNGQHVAVIDTGIYRDAQFLRGFVAEACFLGYGGQHDSSCPNGDDSQIGDGAAKACNFSQYCPHGTHVSGIAVGASMSGVAAFDGVARGATLIPIQAYGRRVCGNNGYGEFDEFVYCEGFQHSDMIAALEYVHDLRSQYPIAAVNLSLGSDDGYSSNCDNSPLKPIIDALRSVNIATVISAGNEGRRGAVGHPGCISSAITVGATNDAGAVADFSNVGPAALVDLVAPGVDVESSCGASSFCSRSGTSMAAPFVAGAAAVLQAQAARTVSALEQRLEATAFRRVDQRSEGVETDLRGLNLLDALASETPRLLLSSSTARNYRTPRPIRHAFATTATRRYWSVTALRQASGVNLDLSQCAGPYQDGCTSNAAAQTAPDEAGLDLELVAVDHNAGRRAVPDALGLRVTQTTAAKPSLPDDGRYAVQFSDAGQVLAGSASARFADQEIVKVYDHYVSAGQRAYVRVVHQGVLDLYAFVSKSGEPASYVQTPATAALKRVNQRAGATEGSFVPVATGYAGLVLASRGGSGGVTVYADSSAPTGTMQVNGGAANTTSRQVTLNLSASDAQTGLDDLRVSVDGGSSWGAWQPYASTVAATLPSGNGVKTVRVEVRNRAHGPAQFSDTITLSESQ